MTHVSSGQNVPLSIRTEHTQADRMANGGKDMMTSVVMELVVVMCLVVMAVKTMVMKMMIVSANPQWCVTRGNERFHQPHHGRRSRLPSLGRQSGAHQAEMANGHHSR